jgi:hypothetical protein
MLGRPYPNEMHPPKSPASSASKLSVNEEAANTQANITPAKPPPPRMANGLVLSQPWHMALPQPKSTPVSTLKNAGKVMDVETPEHLTKAHANTITPNIAGEPRLCQCPTSNDTQFVLPNAAKEPNPKPP